MKKHILTLLGGATIAGLASVSAGALPLAPITAAQDDGLVQNVRLVCNDFGRCYRTGPRHRIVRRHFVDPDYYAPTYGYGPTFAYGPTYAWGGPSIGFGFGFGPRW